MTITISCIEEIGLSIECLEEIYTIESKNDPTVNTKLYKFYKNNRYGFIVFINFKNVTTTKLFYNDNDFFAFTEFLNLCCYYAEIARINEDRVTEAKKLILV